MVIMIIDQFITKSNESDGSFFVTGNKYNDINKTKSFEYAV